MISSEDDRLIARLAFVRQPSEEAFTSAFHLGNVYD